MELKALSPSTGEFNLRDYDETYRNFDWKETEKEFSWYETGKVNMAYEAIDRHAETYQEKQSSLILSRCISAKKNIRLKK